MTFANILAFDTSGPHCATALLQGDELHGARVMEMKRGQAEALMPLLEETLAGRGLAWSDLDALAVGIGPGNFTGIRISVSAARGLALALGIPAVGVSNFEIMAHGNTAQELLVCLPAPREQVYLQLFRYGRPAGKPRLAALSELPNDLGTTGSTTIIGHLAEEISAQTAGSAIPAVLEDIPERIARIARRRLLEEGMPAERPAPLYVRAADAVPPSDPPPVILP
ncbi:tRNA (adenosine(37)-N6)-threonylcarbamoyltransferase complex dimerization subunit type 1 TsaB [Aliiruegeria sabulilitoris]|uniref:tRNA (adenosine(37)-N6)-threonylcarbamoyltransferase complex dimerization subunit type 1 TsaB n=1 Tax=Aliiruegeria sabulilitoris TaxID=1510458 RepID=UPI000829CBAE|nr:tRNA (adenosine(37)-N6)-threonylcarbamoyltransferase complex dimerization subunit type 1 TsaB [Aliiruegeria sabulilitoris]NDR55937.1 tRNA (adenosine(37)-N6)-threonylcarbamoyltransferase complex dimerization subunit type 1 TsaB [Pseudoruegeria sp. M32A2M]